MTEQKTLYQGVSLAAWACVFQYFDLNLGTINVLPRFVAYLMLLSAIRHLEGERPTLALLRPLGIILAVWYGLDWALTCLGLSVMAGLEPLNTIIAVISLYFHFQLFTDLAALAAAYQSPGDGLESRLLQWRTVQTVLLTILALPVWRWAMGTEWGAAIGFGLAVVSLIAGLCLMSALFALRRLFAQLSVD